MAVIILFLSIINVLSPGIKIENAWLRPATRGTNSALYLDIENISGKDDQLLEVSSDVAKVVQIHETYKQGENMGMRKVDLLNIKSHETFHLSPGGFHVMLIRLKEDLKPGDKKQFVLNFRHAGKIKITVPVKNN
jgi:hypothetical protein